MRAKEIVRAAFEAMWREDWDGLSQLLDPEVEWRNPDYAVEPGVRRGRDEFLKAAEAVAGEAGGAFEFTAVEAEDYREIGDCVVVTLFIYGRGSASGVPIDRRFGGLYRLRDGKIVSYAWFREPEEALAAARGESEAGSSTQREDVARAAWEAILKGDWDEVSRWVDVEVEWRNPDYAVESGIRRGFAAFRDAAEAVGGEAGGAFELDTVDTERFVEIGEHVVVTFWLRGRGSASGVPINQRFGGLFRIPADKVVSYGWFREPEEALAAARSEDPG